MKKHFKIELLLSSVVFVLLLIIGLNINTTGDTGDSITHFLYAKYSFKYPQFFFHHWAKPVFVLISSPFAQFGFKGMIVFNCICVTLSLLLIYYTSKNLKLKNNWLIFIIVPFTPLYFKLIFSGLTEYLFGLFLIYGIYLITKHKYVFSAIIISFLPLVRSEGLIILGLFGLFFLIKKNYKPLLFLLSGQILYSIAGYIYYQDILWVFNKIPYANLDSPYGSGSLFDFVHRLNYVIEKPIYMLLFIGSIAIIFNLIKRGLKTAINLNLLLIWSAFALYFIAHTVFWWLGIFNSMGLPRVLNAIVPIIAIIALYGIETIEEKISHNTFKLLFVLVIVLIVSIYPFSNRPEGVVFNSTMFVIEENKLIDEEVIPFLNREFEDNLNNTIYFSHPYFGLKLNIDYFDPSQHKPMNNLFADQIKAGSIVIWDDWFSVMEGNIPLDSINSDSRFSFIKSFERQEKNRIIKYAIFKTIK